MSWLKTDTVTIPRPDYAEPWSSRRVIPWLTVMFAILGIICTVGTGFPFVGIFFDLMANFCWFLTLTGIAYTIWKYRYSIAYSISTNQYKCLISPDMWQWLYGQKIFVLNGINSSVCKVPFVQLLQNSFSIKVLPGTLQKLTDPKFVSELEAFMNQHGCQVSLLPGQRKGGYVVYTIRPALKKDRLFYGR